ncbi:S1C family serine protease [Minwuia sp.]|uniref:S1C family serine protease n=1 Tax=Minwuia sp. TaxID=2493630 RepID=UPI003A902A6B
MALAVFLSACQTGDGANFLVQDFTGYGKNYKKVDVFRLTPGETMAQVKEKIDAKYEVVRKTEVNGYQLETWMYEKWDAQVGPDTFKGKYFVFFVDGKFLDWNSNGDVSYIYSSLERSEPGGRKVAKKKSGTGTGFAISRNGHILTNEHVAGDCKSVNIVRDGVRYAATVVGVDRANDLALLRADFRVSNPMPLSSQALPVLGSAVTVIGFPLNGLVSESMTVTTGVVSAQSGLDNDVSQFQLSAPVNPGNSGGPVINGKGEVIGIVVSKLNSLYAAAATGDFAQNVNFGIKSSIAEIFVASLGAPLHRPATDERPALGTEQLVARYRKSVFLIQCQN